MADTRLLPAFEIKVDGRALADEAYDTIVSIEVHRSFGVAANAHIEMDARDLDRCDFGIGKRVEIELAPDGDAGVTSVFAGTVLSLGCEVTEGFGQFVIDAYDDSYKLGRSTVVKTHPQATYTEVVNAIAKDAGLKAKVSGLPSTTFENVQQFGTPHQFLDRIIRASGCVWSVVGDQLVVAKRTDDGSSVTLTAGDDLRSFRARMSASEQTDEVTVRGWDPAKQESVVGTSTRPSQRSVGIASEKVQGSQPAMAWSRTPVSPNDAQAMATALHQWMDDSRLIGRGETLCRPEIVPGSIVEIDGMGSLFNGKYPVSRVEHRMQPSTGFITRFAVGAGESTSLLDIVGDGPTPTGGNFLGGVTIGIVTNLADPDKLNRVKLQLPYLSDQEDSGWARVVQMGAGKGRGWWMHPELGDEVIVAFENGDPRLPIVIGGVWSKKNGPPDTGALKGDKLENRSYTSAKGHLLNFDDGSKPAIELAHASTKARFRVDDHDGILIEAPDQELVIKNKKGSITITPDGDIILKGTNIQLKGNQDITIDGAANVNVKSKANTAVTANAKLDLKANAPATLQSSAITTVKGSMVKIN